MRLWHYKLLPYLPKSQLISQWRELNSIFKNQPKHILINYVYEYQKDDLYRYSQLVIREMFKRNIKIKSFENFNNYFKDLNKIVAITCYESRFIFRNHHTDKYLVQCFYNLQEKFDRGQKDFDNETYEKLCKFIKEKTNNGNIF